MNLFGSLKFVGKTLVLSCVVANIANANVTPPPPESDDTNQIGQKYSKNSFGFYAKLGFLGYIAQSYCYTYSSYYTCSTEYDYNLVPGISAYYAWRASNGMGVELALEYEYNVTAGLDSNGGFITPAIYFSNVASDTLWRVGLGYDIGLPSANYPLYYNNITYGFSSYRSSYQGIAIMSSSEWILNKNNAIGIFAKASFRWLKGLNASKFDHIMFAFGLSYRFNMGF